MTEPKPFEPRRPPRRGNSVSAYLDAETYEKLLDRVAVTGESVNKVVSASVKEYLKPKEEGKE